MTKFLNKAIRLSLVRYEVSRGSGQKLTRIQTAPIRVRNLMNALIASS